MFKLPLFLLVLGVATAGCVSPAKRLDPAVVKGIQVGSTTREEVHKVLGRPQEELRGSNQKRLATYSYARFQAESTVPPPGILPSKAGGLLLRAVSIIYGENETVENILVHETTTPVYRQMSTVWLGPSITDRETSQIIKGKSRASELEQLLGPPQAKVLSVEGTPVLIWCRSQSTSRFQLRSARQTLFVHLDQLGIVQNYAVTGTPTSDAKK